MPEKKLPHSSVVREPRLVKGSPWWYIEYRLEMPGKKPKRVRKSFDLNRIHNLEARQCRADEIIAQMTERDLTRLKDSLGFALDIKLKSDREYTRITYRSMAGIFLGWLDSKGWGEMTTGKFTREHAQQFLDYALLKRKVGNRTYNNYILNMRSLFFELVNRGHLKENPFSKLQKRKETQKMRVPFDPVERELVAKAVRKRHPQLYLAILLIGYCAIRLSELRRLRIRDIDLDRGLITMGGDQTKNKERAYVTIPENIIPVIRSYGLDKHPSHFFIFGEGKGLHPKDVPCGRNTINNRHREILRSIPEIKGRKGLTTYSWKDTGGIALVRAGVDIMSIKSHFRHKSLRTTQLYLESLGVVNKEIRNLRIDLMALPTSDDDGAGTVE